MGCNPNEQSLYRNANRLTRQIKMLDKSYDDTAVKELLNQYDSCVVDVGKDVCSLSSQSAVFHKRGYVINADIQASRAYDALLEDLGEGEFTVLRPFLYRVVNPHSHTVEACVFLPSDFWEIGKVALGNFYLKDNYGKKYYTQRVATIRGSFLTTYIVLKPNEIVELVLTPIFIAGMTNIARNIAKGVNWCASVLTKGCFFNGKYIKATMKKEAQRILYKKSKTGVMTKRELSLCTPIRSIQKNGGNEITVGKIIRIQVCDSGINLTKYCVSYSFDGIDKKKLSCRIYYTFYKKLKKIDVSCELIKDLCDFKERISLCFPVNWDCCLAYAENNGSLSLLEKDVPAKVERGVVVLGEEQTLVISSYDGSNVVLKQNNENEKSILFTLSDNYDGGKIISDNACMLESRFSVELSGTKEWDKIANEHDVDVLSVRLGGKPYGI